MSANVNVKPKEINIKLKKKENDTWFGSLRDKTEVEIEFTEEQLELKNILQVGDLIQVSLNTNNNKYAFVSILTKDCRTTLQRNYNIIETGSTGNCYYSSVLYGMYSSDPNLTPGIKFDNNSNNTVVSDSYINPMRRPLFDYMIQNKQKYQDFFVDDQFDLFLLDHLNDNTWAEGPIIDAFADYKNVEVYVFKCDKLNSDYFRITLTKKGSVKNSLKIFLWNNGDKHFQFLQPKNVNPQPVTQPKANPVQPAQVNPVTQPTPIQPAQVQPPVTQSNPVQPPLKPPKPATIQPPSPSPSPPSPPPSPPTGPPDTSFAGTLVPNTPPQTPSNNYKTICSDIAKNKPTTTPLSNSILTNYNKLKEQRGGGRTRHAKIIWSRKSHKTAKKRARLFSQRGLNIPQKKLI
jgi:hypothetical protein